MPFASVFCWKCQINITKKYIYHYTDVPLCSLKCLYHRMQFIRKIDPHFKKPYLWV